MNKKHTRQSTRNMQIAFDTEQWLTSPSFFRRYDQSITDEWIEKNILTKGNFEWKKYIEFRRNDWFGGTGFYSRAGKNIGPWKRDQLVDMFDLHVPDKKNFKKSFADVTDERCLSLLQTHKDRPWYIHYSGGTDSTTILAALLKHTTSADRERMCVVCNRISVFESPYFYFNFVEPNFKTMDTAEFLLDKHKQTLYEQSIVIDGNLGDQLHRSRAHFKIIQTGFNDFQPKKDPDLFCKFYMQESGLSLSAARWHYDSLLMNIESVDLPMVTMQDWAWWYFFNVYWVTVKLRLLQQLGISYQLFKKSHVIWYDTQDYQSWAIANRQHVRGNIDVFSYKTEAKQYIYELTKDEYYYHFVQKGYNNGFTNKRLQMTSPWFNTVLEDGSFLYAKTDLREILQLLPNHMDQQ